MRKFEYRTAEIATEKVTKESLNGLCNEQGKEGYRLHSIIPMVMEPPKVAMHQSQRNYLVTRVVFEREVFYSKTEE